MQASTWSILKLYIPIITSIFFLIMIFLVRKSQNGTALKLKLFGELLEMQLPLSSSILVRLLLFIASVFSFSPILFYDYTSFFPNILEMEVFYDREGIQRVLSEFSQEDLKALRIPDNYEVWQEKYYNRLDEDLNKIKKLPHFFTIKDGNVHSTGYVRFKIEAIRGWQKYHYYEGSGELTSVLEIPDMPPIQFKSFFEKLSTKEDYFNLSLSDILFRHYKLLLPEFKQILAEKRKSEGILFHHTVVGIIKVSNFPFPEVANTVYFAKFSDVGLIPIAYAIYK